MNSDLQEKLFQNFPEIFGQKDLSPKETAMCWGISCGDGWYAIIESLCEMIQNEVDQPHKNIERYEKYLEDELSKEDCSKEYVSNLKQTIMKEKSKIIPQVQFVQVKEKFGSLRVYTNNVENDNIYAYISFAETLSEKTCEVCGKYGKPSSGGWIKVTCDDCS